MARDLTKQPDEFRNAPIESAWYSHLIYLESIKRGLNLIKDVNPFDVSPEPFTQFLKEKKIYIPWQTLKIQKQTLAGMCGDCNV